jgi:3D (Asp-Asp-Asp) domain-containing protein
MHTRLTNHLASGRSGSIRSSSRPARSGRPARSVSRVLAVARWQTIRSAGRLTLADAGMFGLALAIAAGSAIIFKELQARGSIAPAAAAIAQAQGQTDGRSGDQVLDPTDPNSAADTRDQLDAGIDVTIPFQVGIGPESESDEPELVDPVAAGLIDPSPFDTVLPLNASEMVPGFDSLATAPVTTAVPAAQDWPLDTRWFNGRPVRPVKTMSMVVTAYSPDARSCGDSADGITASLHHVETNAGKLVAADPRVLPMGSMISIPGYDSGRIVPVLDIGGAIKGNRLDVLFPTHEQARQFGKRRIQVTVWGYADGQAKTDWRKIRDSK